MGILEKLGGELGFRIVCSQLLKRSPQRACERAGGDLLDAIGEEG